ncbi:uncharacterized protein [Rutidosis leptorrhynchoides]|uniref:uncharacterized protein n=1 Tax=Rutidosis leptorrhynchoides TaxID=125765 RepID=UPI003A9951C3
MTYLGIPLGIKMNKSSAWLPIIEKFRKMLADWKIFHTNHDSLWARIIVNIYGTGRGLGSTNNLQFAGNTIWTNIVKVGQKIDNFGIAFSTSITKSISNESTTKFWTYSWMGSDPLKDVFNRLFVLESDKMDLVQDRVIFTEETRRFNWQWCREPRGRAIDEVEAIENLINAVSLNPNAEDKISWNLDADGIFSTKSLASQIDGKKLQVGNNVIETVRNKLIPQKVSIFVWRAKLQRLPVRFELDKRGIDINTLLYPICGDEVEKVDHVLIQCRKVVEF